MDRLGQGAGKPTIAFINGTLQTTMYWKTVGKKLADRFRLLLYDCRGQGESDLGDQSLTLKLHADDLQALLYELGIHQTHVVGISHGARVALALAGSQPELVARMVLCSISTHSTFRVFKNFQKTFCMQIFLLMQNLNFCIITSWASTYARMRIYFSLP